jgi:hypothetical protein
MGNTHLENLKEAYAKNESFLRVRKEPKEETIIQETELLDEIDPLSAGAAIATTALIGWAHKKYMEAFGQANKACAKLGGKEGRICRKNYRIKAAKAEIQALKYARSKCGKAADRKACVATIGARIKEIQAKHPETQFKED